MSRDADSYLQTADEALMGLYNPEHKEACQAFGPIAALAAIAAALDRLAAAVETLADR